MTKPKALDALETLFFHTCIEYNKLIFHVVGIEPAPVVAQSSTSPTTLARPLKMRIDFYFSKLPMHKMLISNTHKLTILVRDGRASDNPVVKNHRRSKGC